MLYRLSPDSNRRFRYAWKDISFEGYQKHVCAECGRTVAELCFNSPWHCLLLEGGGEYPDFLGFTGAGEQMLLFSDRAVECLRDHKITGFSSAEPVTVCNEKRNPLTDAPGYRHLKITGVFDLDYSAMQLKKETDLPILRSIRLEPTEDACLGSG